MENLGAVLECEEPEHDSGTSFTANFTEAAQSEESNAHGGSPEFLIKKSSLGSNSSLQNCKVEAMPDLPYEWLHTPELAEVTLQSSPWAGSVLRVATAKRLY